VYCIFFIRNQIFIYRYIELRKLCIIVSRKHSINERAIFVRTEELRDRYIVIIADSHLRDRMIIMRNETPTPTWLVISCETFKYKQIRTY